MARFGALRVWGWVACAMVGAGCATVRAPEAPREGARTSGTAHFELAPLEHATANPACGANVTLPRETAAMLEDDAQGADVTCRYDATHFEASLYGDVGGLELSGTFDPGGARSLDAAVRIDLPGTRYRSTGACTVVFDGRSPGVLSGWFSCPELESSAVACAVPGADATGRPVSVFRFRDCTSI